MKHVDRWGDLDSLAYAHEISKMKSHKERMDYISDVDEKAHDLLYLLCMQMALPKTIASLPTREERKKAWDELPEHTRSLKGMKNMVYHRVVRLFRK